jgi:hypothetical protein
VSLVAADLRALGNLAATAQGRRLATGTLIGFLMLGTMSAWFADAILHAPQLLVMVRQQSGDATLRGLLGYGLLACPLVATWLGLALAQRQLFEAPELQLWRLSPLPSITLPLHVLLRASFLSSCWALALAGPFVVTLLLQSPNPALAIALVPLAVVAGTVPLLAVLLAVHIVLVRFLAGRWLRLVFVLVGAGASVAFSVWLLLTLFASGQERALDVAAVAGDPAGLPWTVAPGATLLAAADRGRLDTDALLHLLATLAASVAVFATVATLHPKAHERHLAAEPPSWRAARRRWPQGLAAVVRKKEFAQLLQQPGALLGFLLFAGMVLALAKGEVLVGGMLGNDRLPRHVVHTAVLLAQWFLAVLLVLYAHMGRLVAWDQAQWSLYVAAPADPGAILRGKLQAVFVFLLWPLLLVLVSGAWLLGAGQATLAATAGVALGGTLGAVGVLAVIGTLPILVRPDDGGQVQQGGKNFLGAILLVLGFEVVASPAMFGWLWLLDHSRRTTVRASEVAAWTPWVIGASLVYGALLAVVGTGLGTRNFARMLRPR